MLSFQSHKGGSLLAMLDQIEMYAEYITWSRAGSSVIVRVSVISTFLQFFS